MAETIEPFRVANREWNDHAMAGDAVYNQFKDRGGYPAWAAANGKPIALPELPSPEKTYSSLMKMAISAELRTALKLMNGAAKSGNLPVLKEQSAWVSQHCASLGIAIPQAPQPPAHDPHG